MRSTPARHSYDVLLNMKTLIALLFIAIVQADGSTKQWPPAPFEYVVGYCYDFTQDPRGSAITFPDGSIHKGVIKGTTVRLSGVQVTSLRALLSIDSKTENGNVDCYDPHHAFVFYDADWKVTASIDICLFCEDYVARPKGASSLIDLQALEAFCRVIGLPILKDSSNYTALYRQEQSKSIQQPLPKGRDTEPPVSSDLHDDPFALDPATTAPKK